MARNQLGRDIKRRRKQLGLSQSKLAELSGIGQGHISQIENGSRRPNLATLHKLREALGLPPDEFADWIEKAAAA